MLFLTLCLFVAASFAQVTNDCNDYPIYYSRLVPGFTQLYKLENAEERYTFVGHTVNGLLALRTNDDEDVGSETTIELAFKFANADVRAIDDTTFQTVDLHEALVAAFCEWGVYYNETDCGYEDGFDLAQSQTQIVSHNLRLVDGSDEGQFYTDNSYLHVSVRVQDEEGNTLYPSQAQLLALDTYFHFIWNDELTLFFGWKPYFELLLKHC